MLDLEQLQAVVSPVAIQNVAVFLQFLKVVLSKVCDHVSAGAWRDLVQILALLELKFLHFLHVLLELNGVLRE